MARAAGGDGNAGPGMSGVEARWRRRRRLWRRSDRHVDGQCRVRSGYAPGSVALRSLTTAGTMSRELISVSGGVTEIPGRRRHGRYSVVGGIEKRWVRAGNAAVGATAAREARKSISRRRSGGDEGG